MGMWIIDEEATEEREPLHQLLLGLIQEVNSVPELNFMRPFVLRGIIPKDHERIAEAWKEKCDRFGHVDLGERGAQSLMTHKLQIERAAARAAQDAIRRQDEDSMITFPHEDVR